MSSVSSKIMYVIVGRHGGGSFLFESRRRESVRKSTGAEIMARKLFRTSQNSTF